MTNLRTASQQALEFLDAEFGWSPGEAPRIDALRAALAQAEPQGCATEEDCTKQPWCRIRGKCQRKQAEPLNLSDPAVRKRLASQWGYVHEAQQAEPAEPVAKMTAGRAVYFVGRFKCEEKLLGPNEQAALDFVISMLGQQAEPAQEPAFHGFMSDDGTQVDVCFSPSAPRKDGTYATAYYTAPPQRTMVPLTEEEIYKIFKHLCNTVGVPSYKTMARAVERAHGIKEN